MYSWRLILCVFAAYIGALHYGLLVPQLNVSNLNTDCGEPSKNNCIAFPGHSTFSWTLATSLWVIGGAVGALSCRYPNDYLGRKSTLSINAVIMIIGGVLEAIAPSIAILSLGRFISGIASGTGTTVSSVYASEISPAKIRGKIGTGLQMSLVCGILLQQVLVFAFATPDLWRLLLGVPIVFGCLQLLLYGVILESPVFLYLHRLENQAYDVVQKLYAKENHDQIFRELIGDTFVQNVILEEELAESGERGTPPPTNNSNNLLHRDGNTPSSTSTVSLWAELFSRTYSIPLLIAVGLSVFQQFSGINAVFFYSSQFFDKAGIDNINVANVITGAVNVVATMIALSVMDYYGRRTLLLVSSSGMFLSALALTFCLYYKAGIPSIIFTCLFVTFFEFGLGPLPWLMFSEIFPEKLRAIAGSVASCVNWIANLIIGFSFPYIARGLGAYSFVPFMVILIICFIFVQFIVIETKCKTLEQIQEEWNARARHKLNLNKNKTTTETTEYEDCNATTPPMPNYVASKQ